MLYYNNNNIFYNIIQQLHRGRRGDRGWCNVVLCTAVVARGPLIRRAATVQLTVVRARSAVAAVEVVRRVRSVFRRRACCVYVSVLYIPDLYLCIYGR